MRKFFSFLVGTVMGALVGATVALLLAPSSGETLRGQIRERFEALQAELTEAANEKRAELEEYLDTLREPKSTGIEIEK
jgi:gas vesicle protein